MINPNEISEVLKQQLRDVNAKVSFEEVGTVPVSYTHLRAHET